MDNDWSFDEFIDDCISEAVEGDVEALSKSVGETLAPYVADVSSLCDVRASMPEFEAQKALLMQVKAFAQTLTTPEVLVDGAHLSIVFKDEFAARILEHGNSWMPPTHLNLRVKKALDKAVGSLLS